MKRSRKTNTWITVGTLWVLVTTLTACGCLLLFNDVFGPIIGLSEVQDMSELAEEGAYYSSDLTEVMPKKIDFQPIVDKWVYSIGGEKSVVIYDLERDEVVGGYNMDSEYNTASLYKLFVVYEGYRRIEVNQWQPDAPAGISGYTVKECLDLAIRESFSPCAEAIWQEIGQDELDEIIEQDYGITNSDILEMLSNSSDIALMMQMYYRHGDIKNELLVAQMKDSFLNQPATEYNWRQGLPSGFSDKVNVYNKVGWDYDEDKGYWNVYHDAAIVEFPLEDRHFVVVVMTSEVSFENIRQLGAMIEETFYSEV